MATYNWRYKSGSTLPNGQVVAASADDVRPSNCYYLALYGNDITGNGSRLKPYKTIEKLNSFGNLSGLNVIISSGVFRLTQNTIFNEATIIGDGDVKIDGYTNIITFCSGGGCYFYNLKLANVIFYRGPTNEYVFNNCEVDSITSTFNEAFVFFNSVIKNSIISVSNGFYKGNNNTFINCYLGTKSQNVVTVKSNIYYQCNIDAVASTSEDFSLYYQCNFRAVTTTSKSVATAFYPSTPAGYTQINSISSLQALYSVYSPISPLFTKCIFLDPKFNNPVIGDYSLAFDSPAKNLSYFGTYVGGKSIGYPIKADATEVDGDFDFSTAVNIIIADNSIRMADDSLLSVIETNCKANLIQRAFSKVSIQGFNADRNGQYIDSIADLSGATVSAGTNLVANTPYLVSVASITYNGAVILAGERFTTTTVLSFTSAGGGLCREILEAPQRHTVEARFGDGGAIKTVGDAFTIGYWYYVNGTITYNGVDYTDRTFKAIDTNSFTGTGTVVEALTTEAYQHYELGVAFTSNNVGDSRTGAIVRGNGDPAYERGTTKEFPINARFAQIKFTIQPNNLKP